MKILLLGGFLGTGKTSLLLRVGQYLAEHSAATGAVKVAVVENEIGEIGVDDKLVESAGFTTTSLFSGCICCTLGVEIVSTIETIEREYAPDYLIIESSGVGIPFKIQETIQERLDMRSSIAVLADCQRWMRLSRAAIPLIKDQLHLADILIANKADLVTETERAEIITDLQARCPQAEVFACSLTQDGNEAIFARIRAHLEVQNDA